MNNLSVEIKWKVQIHELEDLNCAMQLIMDIEDEFVESQVKNYMTQSVYAFVVDGHKGGWLTRAS